MPSCKILDFDQKIKSPLIFPYANPLQVTKRSAEISCYQFSEAATRGVLYKKSLQIFCKIHSNTPVPESFFNKAADWDLQFYEKETLA